MNVIIAFPALPKQQRQRPEKFWPERGFKPWRMRCPCSALPERVWIPVQARIFQAFPAAAQAALQIQWSSSFIPLRISNTNTCVIIIYLHIYRLIRDPHDDLLPVGLIDQLVEHCTDNVEVRVSNPRSGLKFSGLSHCCLSSTRNAMNLFPTITQYSTRTLITTIFCQ